MKARADAYAAEMRRLVDEPPKTGRIYRLKDGRLHQASAPGEAPASRVGPTRLGYGILIKSITSVMFFGMGGRVEATVSIGAKYAGYLEYGTSKMRPRPFVFRAIERVNGVSK
jgi:HK97 gp10 family phage protein